MTNNKSIDDSVEQPGNILKGFANGVIGTLFLGSAGATAYAGHTYIMHDENGRYFFIAACGMGIAAEMWRRINPYKSNPAPESGNAQEILASTYRK